MYCEMWGDDIARERSDRARANKASEGGVGGGEGGVGGGCSHSHGRELLHFLA